MHLGILCVIVRFGAQLGLWADFSDYRTLSFDILNSVSAANS